MNFQKTQQKLLVVLLSAFLAMNYPFLMLASRQELIFGLPMLTLYLFGLWALLIVIVRRLIKQLQQSDQTTNNA